MSRNQAIIVNSSTATICSEPKWPRYRKSLKFILISLAFAEAPARFSSALEVGFRKAVLQMPR